LIQAETLIRISLSKDPDDPVAYAFLGSLARALNLNEFALEYFRRARKLAPQWEVPTVNVAQLETLHRDGATTIDAEVEGRQRFLLIKAWGYGFWSDVFHVLGQLLLAEMTNRTPVVYWGANSRFGDGTAGNAFEFFFEPVSGVSMEELEDSNLSFFPDKWNYSNLRDEDIDKWRGKYSRLTGLFCLGRSEDVVVSDFYTGVINLMPWIPAHHPLVRSSVDEIYGYLVEKYLKPTSGIRDAVNNFFVSNLEGNGYMSVHIRGSDKIDEHENLHEINRKYTELVDRELERDKGLHIFLMTDDDRIHEEFCDRYGDRIISTDCQRTTDNRGIHYYENADGRKLGEEVMLDTYLAARAKKFIGHGGSNPSLMVRYLMGWENQGVQILDEITLHHYNTFLHKW
jgi:hypothetical protein